MLKKSTMELDCSEVFVVLDDADIAKAVLAAIVARLADAGRSARLPSASSCCAVWPTRSRFASPFAR